MARRSDVLRLKDIAAAADTVASYLNGVSREEFLAGGMVQDAVLRQLIVAGEAAFKVSGAFQEAHPEIPWVLIAGFRHRLVHDYFGIDLDTVWQVAHWELPELAKGVVALLGRVESEGEGTEG